MIKNVLLTGGTGFLGSHILNGLLDANYNVTVLVRKSSNLYRIENIKEIVEFFFIDENMSNLDDLFSKKKIEAIIHTATEYGRNCLMSQILESNLIFPVKLIESGIKHNLKVFINSDTFFGKNEFQNMAYLNDYTNSKKYFLDYLFSNNEKIKTVSLRLEHIFGESDSNNKFVTSVLDKLLKSENEILLTDGLQKRDFVYVDDVVAAYLKVLQNIDRIDNFTEFEVGKGESISIRQFVELMAVLTKAKSKLIFGALPNRKGEIQDSKANIEPLYKLGWSCKFDIKTALKKIIELETDKNSI